MQYIREHPHLLFGCQVIPAVPCNWPDRFGHTGYQVYTYDGRNVAEHFEDAVLYSDGSCYKKGHHSMVRAGRALIALTPEGDLAAAIWGQVGQCLPQTSPASEFVAGLAAAGFRAREVRTDFAGLASLGFASFEALANRRNIYSGIRVQIKGRRPDLGFSKIKGHVDPESCTLGSQEWQDAVGNQLADRHARMGAAMHLQPSQEELDAVRREKEVLHRFLQYSCQALLRWEPVGPASSTRKHLLPRLPALPDLAPGALGRSFRHDVLGPWAAAEGVTFGDSLPPPPPEEERPAPRRLRGKQPARFSSGFSRGGVPPKTLHHEWRYSRGRWVCWACLKVSRATAPSRSVMCPGFNAVMFDLVQNPSGHSLSYSSFLDGAGIIILCTRCGGYCSSTRRNPKLSDSCLGRPASACGGAALARMCKQQHPVHAKGDKVVLDAWRPLTDLARPLGGPRADATP